jgi:hypothetical protein
MTLTGDLNPTCRRVHYDDLESALVCVRHDLSGNASPFRSCSVPNGDEHTSSIHDLLARV